MKKVIVSVFALLFVMFYSLVTAGPDCAAHKKKEAGEGCAAAGGCVMNLDADYSVANTKDGAVITIKSKKGGAEAKTIQETAKKCIEMCAGKMGGNTAAADEEVVCPVMGVKMKKSKAFETVQYEGKTYYMCCAGCKEKFLKDPKKYIGK